MKVNAILIIGAGLASEPWSMIEEDMDSWLAVSESDVRATIPIELISHYTEEELPYYDLFGMVDVSVERIIGKGIEKDFEESRLWELYGFPRLVDAALRSPYSTFAMFRLAAALQLEGAILEDQLWEFCSTDGLQEMMRDEIKKYHEREMRKSVLFVSTWEELNSAFVKYGFLAQIPKTCYPIFGENLVLMHRIYRQGLGESVGEPGRPLVLSVHRGAALWEAVKPILAADPVAMKLGHIEIEFINEKDRINVYDFLATVTAQAVHPRDGLFRWCGPEVCLARAREDRVDLARAMGRILGLRLAKGLDLGLSLPRNYVDVLSGKISHDANSELNSLVKGFREIVAGHLLDGLNDFIAGEGRIPVSALKREVSVPTNADNVCKMIGGFSEEELRRFLLILAGTSNLNRRDLDVMRRFSITEANTVVNDAYTRNFELIVPRGLSKEQLKVLVLKAVPA